MIPKVIYKIFLSDVKDVSFPPDLNAAIDSFRTKNPGYTVNIMCSDECIQFMDTYFPQYKKHYLKLRPYAYRCDLIRLLILYQLGGIYSDLRQVCLEPMDALLGSGHSFYVAHDAPPNQLCLYNAFIASTPGHRILKKTIDLLIFNIEHDHYGLDCLYPTGPGALMYGGIDFLRDPDVLVGRHLLANPSEFVVFGKLTMVQCKYNNARGADNQDLPGTNNYGQMWWHKEIYNVVSEMRITYAIPVCREAKELESLLNFLEKTKNAIDDINVLVDTKNVTPAVRSVLAAHPKVSVCERDFCGDFSAHRNYHIEQCKGDWIFMIDADEIPQEHLVNSLRTMITYATSKNSEAIYVPRINICPGYAYQCNSKFSE